MAKHLGTPAPMTAWEEADNSPRALFTPSFPRHKDGGETVAPVYAPSAVYQPFAPVPALVHVNQLPATAPADVWLTGGRTL